MTRETFYNAADIRLQRSPRVIWLASWYPSVTSPYNGDFVQRHAIAVAGYEPIVVIHTIHQAALDTPVQYEVTTREGLTEIIVYFRHDEEPQTLMQKIRYNTYFNKYTQRLLLHIVSTHGNPALLHVHIPIKMGRIALWAKRKWGLPFMVSEQSSAYLPAAKDAFERRSWLYRTSVSKIFREALAVSNVSYAVGSIQSELFHRNDIRVIRNLADPSIFYYQEKTPNKKFRFIHVSTLKYQKNVRGILDTMQQLWTKRNDFELVILGGEQGVGEDWPRGIEEAPWLIIKGMVEHDQVALHMRGADCLVLFSRDENFPCVIVEALCCGLPVISSDAGGCGEAIDASNGIIVPSENREELLQALSYLIDHHAGYNSKEIADAAIQQYSASKVGKDFIDLYTQKGIL